MSRYSAPQPQPGPTSSKDRTVDSGKTQAHAMQVGRDQESITEKTTILRLHPFIVKSPRTNHEICMKIMHESGNGLLMKRSFEFV